MTSSSSQPGTGPLVIAVGGGKGGVGKSVIAVNLSLSLARLGANVTLVDADLGSANVHTMLGIERPGLTLQALFDGRAKHLHEVAVPSGYPNLQLIPGSVAVPGAANLQHARKLRLLRQLRKLPGDVVVVDCGAGIHFNVVDFFTAADVQLLIASAQLVSLQNAYGFLKASVYRMLRRVAQEHGKAELVESATDQSEVETVGKLLSVIRERDEVLGDLLALSLEDARFYLLGNQLSDARETNALQALSRMIQSFLHLSVPVLGALPRRDHINLAVTRRKPFVAASSEPEARLLLQIAEQLLRTHATVQRPDRTGDFRLPDGQERPAPRTSGIAYRSAAAEPESTPLTSTGRARTH